MQRNSRNLEDIGDCYIDLTVAHDIAAADHVDDIAAADHSDATILAWRNQLRTFNAHPSNDAGSGPGAAFGTAVSCKLSCTSAGFSTSSPVPTWRTKHNTTDHEVL